MGTDIDLAWAAGFLEGEGSFGLNCGYPRVQATQVYVEPLERLRAMLGGSLRVDTRKRFSDDCVRKPLHIWTLAAYGAESAMLELRPLMTARRRAEIDAVLAFWALSPRRRRGPQRGTRAVA